MKRTVAFGLKLLLSLGATAAIAIAQNQPGSSNSGSQSGDSLADYARSIRKDSGANQKPKVFDNDNLPRTDKLSIVGPPETAAASENSSESKDESNSAGAAKSDARTGTDNMTAAEAKGDESKSAAGSTPSAAKPGDEEAVKQALWKEWGDKIKAQQDQIDLLNRELNVLQKEYEIRVAAFFSDAGNRLRNSADWDKQDAQYKQQIADKQKAVEDAKQQLEDMQESARKAGVPASVREP